MTKFEIRTQIMALLALQPGDWFWDIGAGTGSISIQAALFGAKVTAIEEKSEATLLIQQNTEKFNLKIEVIQSKASQALDRDISCNKCFIGGSGGELKVIVQKLQDKLKPGGLLVASFIRLENLTILKEQLVQFGYKRIETRLLQVALEDERGMMKARNPIFILSAVKS